MNEETKELLREFLKEAENDWSLTGYGEGHYVHRVRKLWSLANDFRFPEDERNSLRMFEEEFIAYSVGLCSERLDMYNYCGHPTVNRDDSGFTLEHLECKRHANYNRELYGEMPEPK